MPLGEGIEGIMFGFWAVVHSFVRTDIASTRLLKPFITTSPY